MIRIGRRHRLVADCAGRIRLVVGALDASGQLRALENAAADARARLLRREVAVGHRHRRHRLGQRRGARQLAVAATPSRQAARRTDRSASRGACSSTSISARRRMHSMTRCSMPRWRRRRDFPVLAAHLFPVRERRRWQRIVSRPLAAVRAQHRTGRGQRRGRIPMASRANGATSGRWTASARRASSTRVGVLPDEQSVLIDFSISPTSFTYVSYVDVLEGRVPRDVLRRQDGVRRRDGARTRRHARRCRCTAPCPASWCRRWPPRP